MLPNWFPKLRFSHEALYKSMNSRSSSSMLFTRETFDGK